MFRSKAPLRLGFAGGGTDVHPYSTQYGGAVLNATINLYAHATIEPLSENAIVLKDNDTLLRFDSNTVLPVDHALALTAGVYNRMQQQFGNLPAGLSITTSVDVPMGSGLGTSSTLVVALIGAFASMLSLPLSKYEIAKLAYDIERNDLGFAGGHQDQYAASFGGINYMEFFENDTVSVQPIMLTAETLQYMEDRMLLYYTGNARQSGQIIQEQQANVINNQQESVAAMHQLKKQAQHMKKALLQNRLDMLGQLFDFGFEQKRKMAKGISNPHIETIYDAAKNAGATGGKISGAGGGGFMYFYCPPSATEAVTKTLNSFDGKVWPFKFTTEGMQAGTNS
ncbi:MAG TPA: hypothetical protein VLC98_05390 [Phnomibacter sp.]|nr:hypothetical protein [Phnomibacter sp.]